MISTHLFLWFFIVHWSGWGNSENNFSKIPLQWAWKAFLTARWFWLCCACLHTFTRLNNFPKWTREKKTYPREQQHRVCWKSGPWKMDRGRWVQGAESWKIMTTGLDWSVFLRSETEVLVHPRWPLCRLHWFFQIPLSKSVKQGTNSFTRLSGMPCV